MRLLYLNFNSHGFNVEIVSALRSRQINVAAVAAYKGEIVSALRSRQINVAAVAAYKKEERK